MSGLEASPVIHPLDKNYLEFVYLLFLPLIFLLVDWNIPISIPRIYFILYILFSYLTLLVLSHRQITPVRAAALRLSLTPDQYAKEIQWKAIISEGWMQKYFIQILCGGLSLLGDQKWAWSNASKLGAMLTAVVDMGKIWKAVLEDKRGKEANGSLRNDLRIVDQITIDGEWKVGNKVGLILKNYNVWIRGVTTEMVGGVKMFEVAVSEKNDRRNKVVGQVVRVTI